MYLFIYVQSTDMNIKEIISHSVSAMMSVDVCLFDFACIKTTDSKQRHISDKIGRKDGKIRNYVHLEIFHGDISPNEFILPMKL